MIAAVKPRLVVIHRRIPLRSLVVVSLTHYRRTDIIHGFYVEYFTEILKQSSWDAKMESTDWYYPMNQVPRAPLALRLTKQALNTATRLD